MEIERRVFPVEGVEFRESADGNLNFRGHAAMFDSLSDPIEGKFLERISAGAFAKTIRESDIRFLINHNPDLLLARSKQGKGTMQLSEEGGGLLNEASMAPTSYARDLGIVMERRDLDQMSFGFVPLKQSWDRSNPQMPIRTLHEVRLFDVSAVTFPAYPQTTAAVRSQVRQIRAMAAGAEMAPTAMPDDDPAMVIQAIDAALDEAMEACMEGDMSQCMALMVAASCAADAMMAMMGSPEMDDAGRAAIIATVRREILVPEWRVGKSISAKNADAIRAAIAALTKLLDATVTPEQKNSLMQDVEARQRRLRQLRLLTAV